jgi:hypothetical protein
LRQPVYAALHVLREIPERQRNFDCYPRHWFKLNRRGSGRKLFLFEPPIDGALN